MLLAQTVDGSIAVLRILAGLGKLLLRLRDGQRWRSGQVVRPFMQPREVYVDVIMLVCEGVSLPGSCDAAPGQPWPCWPPSRWRPTASDKPATLAPLALVAGRRMSWG